MLRALVQFSLRFRGVVVALACLLLGYGLYVAAHAKLDVYTGIHLACSLDSAVQRGRWIALVEELVDEVPSVPKHVWEGLLGE